MKIVIDDQESNMTGKCVFQLHLSLIVNAVYDLFKDDASHAIEQVSN